MDSAVETVATRLRERGLTIAVAESLTCGALASALGAGSEASRWFRGGVVAYMDDVKFTMLGVTPGPVITDRCAREMATGVRSRLGADLAIAVTGAGGPGPQEGEPEGTVFLAIATVDGVRSMRRQFTGDPEAVLAQTIETAIGLALDATADR